MKKKILIIFMCLVLVFTFSISQITACNVAHIVQDGLDIQNCPICMKIEFAIVFLSVLNIGILTCIIFKLMGVIHFQVKSRKEWRSGTYTLIHMKVQLNN